MRLFSVKPSIMKYDSIKKSCKRVPEVGKRGVLVREPSPLSGVTPSEMKRLTIDVPAYFHANVKAGCARRGMNTADAIRELLEERCGNIEE